MAGLLAGRWHASSVVVQLRPRCPQGIGPGTPCDSLHISPSQALGASLSVQRTPFSDLQEKKSKKSRKHKHKRSRHGSPRPEASPRRTATPDGGQEDRRIGDEERPAAKRSRHGTDSPRGASTRRGSADAKPVPPRSDRARSMDSAERRGPCGSGRDASGRDASASPRNGRRGDSGDPPLPRIVDGDAPPGQGAEDQRQVAPEEGRGGSVSPRQRPDLDELRAEARRAQRDASLADSAPRASDSPRE